MRNETVNVIWGQSMEFLEKQVKELEFSLADN